MQKQLHYLKDPKLSEAIFLLWRTQDLYHQSRAFGGFEEALFDLLESPRLLVDKSLGSRLISWPLVVCGFFCEETLGS